MLTILAYIKDYKPKLLVIIIIIIIMCVCVCVCVCVCINSNCILCIGKTPIEITNSLCRPAKEDVEHYLHLISTLDKLCDHYGSTKPTLVLKK